MLECGNDHAGARGHHHTTRLPVACNLGPPDHCKWHHVAHSRQVAPPSRLEGPVGFTFEVQQLSQECLGWGLEVQAFSGVLL